jgi:hypothetical protein
MVTLLSRGLVGVLVLVAGCSPAAGSPASLPGSAPVPPKRKTTTIVMGYDFNGLVGDIERTGATVTPSAHMHEFANAYLNSRDHNDEIVPHLAVELPSVDRGSWRVLDDGRMEVTWRDVRFGWEPIQFREALLGARAA